ncbi:DUF3263 domain-containing protein [Demequina globuliformis]|uniref:DUF3263 domain-containing protein n=1 Tax=Demequina globuliformis TaxID=676202 RepID=UPI000AA3E92F|nr:DUF3263 domain-containing protein [Demequina globuliformis]
MTDVTHLEAAADDRSSLSERDRAVLEFERRWWAHAGAKEEAIRSEFSLSVTQYYQVLGSLLESHAAVEFDPMLVTRLRRLRATREHDRSSRAWIAPGAR